MKTKKTIHGLYADYLDERLTALGAVRSNWRENEDTARPIGYHWRLTDAHADLVARLPKLTRKALKVLKAILADAIMCAKCYPGRRVSCSRRRDWWTAQAMYAGDEWTRDTVTAAVDWLVSEGYLVKYDKRAPGARGMQSTYLPSPDLVEFAMPVVSKEPMTTIILKDENGVVVPYKPSIRTRRADDVVKAVNRALNDADIELGIDGLEVDGRYIVRDGRKIPTDLVSLRRIFNGGFSYTGRFYGGWWQMVSSEDRRFFLIDGKETVEVDFAQIHPRILYMSVGAKAPKDAYEIEGYERDLVKTAFNAILNAPSWLSARGAVAKHMDEDKRGAKNLIAAIKAKHPEIAHLFHTGLGVRLQNNDAEICEYVLKEMTVKRGVVVLPVHDSFIVPEDSFDLLVETMKDGFEKVVGKVENRNTIVKSTVRNQERKTMPYSKTAHITAPLPSPAPSMALAPTSRHTPILAPSNVESAVGDSESSVVSLASEKAVERETSEASLGQSQDTDTGASRFKGRQTPSFVSNGPAVVEMERPHQAGKETANKDIEAVDEEPTERKAIYRPAPAWLKREVEQKAEQAAAARKKGKAR